MGNILDEQLQVWKKCPPELLLKSSSEAIDFETDPGQQTNYKLT